MKVEKISETQVKVILSDTDLKERNIKLTEFAYGSEKTHELFREMMEQAMTECDFRIENAPLMIEAIPVSSESIVLIVTKIQNESELENKFNLFPKTKDERKYKKTPILDNLSKREDTGFYAFSFQTLDDASGIAPMIRAEFEGNSVLFKEKGKYILLLNSFSNIPSVSSALLARIGEYGQRMAVAPVFRYYLDEHAEIIISRNALDVLAKYV